MPRLNWALCCQRAIVDKEDDSLSLLDLFEGVTLNKLPARREDGAIPLVPMRFVLVTHWSRSDQSVPEAAMMRVRLLTPSGNSLVEATAPIQLENAINNRNMVKYPGLPVPESGQYTIEIALKEGDKWTVSSTAAHIQVVVAAATGPASTAGEPPNMKRKRKKTATP